jgi:DNA-binding CsgD family transcriptional regulator
MRSKLIPKNHISLTSHSEVSGISKTLVEQFNLLNFNFVRFYKTTTGQRISFSLGMMPELNLLAAKNVGAVATPRVFSNISQVSIFQNLIQEIESETIKRRYEKQARQQAEMFKGGSELWFKLEKQNYVDSFEFLAKENDPYALNRFLNNLELIKHFTSYFYDKAEDLIKEGEKNPIVFPMPRMSLTTQETEHKKLNKKEFLQAHPITKLSFENSLQQKITLSKRDIDCAQLLAQGLTAREIGKRLHLSVRTIESRINILKQKTFCTSKQELGEQLKPIFSNRLSDCTTEN